jgi:hypothetical protein
VARRLAKPWRTVMPVSVSFRKPGRTVTPVSVSLRRPGRTVTPASVSLRRPGRSVGGISCFLGNEIAARRQAEGNYLNNLSNLTSTPTVDVRKCSQFDV